MIKMDKNNWRRLYLENEYQLKQLTNDYNKLVEENNNIKDELKNNELDYTTIYMNGVYDGEKKVKDKIKNKIEQLELFKKALPIRGTEIERFIGELKELLEEN